MTVRNGVESGHSFREPTALWLSFCVALREHQTVAPDLNVEMALRRRVTRRQANSRASKLMVAEYDAFGSISAVAAEPEGFGGSTANAIGAHPSPSVGRCYVAKVSNHRSIMQ